jgi:diguanylate cyclase (GGDEF)-like protein
VKAEEVAETIRSRVEKESPVTISIGVSASREGSAVEEVVKQADEAMYQSKMSGKNKVTLHQSMQRSRSRGGDGSSKKNIHA